MKYYYVVYNYIGDKPNTKNVALIVMENDYFDFIEFNRKQARTPVILFFTEISRDSAISYQKFAEEVNN